MLEWRAFTQLQYALRLKNESRIAYTMAQVINQRMSTEGPVIRYSFQIPGRGEVFEAMRTSGWGDAWVPISETAWQQAQQDNGHILVAYIPEHPEANEPIGRAGNPIGDSAFSWAFFALVDLLWLADSWVMLRNYSRCLQYSERRVPIRMSFWKSVALPTATEQYASQIRRKR